MNGGKTKINTVARGVEKVWNPTPLIDDDWMCPEIVDREEQRQEFFERIFSYYLDGKKPPGVYYVCGKSGSGKTFVIKKMIEQYYNDIKVKIPFFEYVYVQATKLRHPSFNQLLIYIDKQLSNYLPVNINNSCIEEVKEWKDATSWYVLEGILKKGVNLLLVIDEVDKFFNYERNWHFMRFFTETRYDYNLFPIFITNDKKLKGKMPFDLRSRLCLESNFRDYSVDELFRILKTTAKYSLDGVSDDELIMIAKEVGDTTRSARDAKRLLYHYVLTGDLERAIAKYDGDSIKNEILDLTPHQQMTLFAIFKMDKIVEDMKKKSIPLRYKKTFISSKDTYKEYKRLCKKKGLTPKTYRTFTNILNSLRASEMINYGRVHLGRGVGTAGVITINDEIKVYFDEMIESSKIFKF